MKRIELNSSASPHFIGSWNILDDDLCKNIINFFNNNPEFQKKGSTGSGVNEKIKKSIDMTINPNSLKEKNYNIFNVYFNHLNNCFLDYREQFSYLKTMINKINIGPFNIQKYESGDHFSKKQLFK